MRLAASLARKDLRPARRLRSPARLLPRVSGLALIAAAAVFAASPGSAQIESREGIALQNQILGLRQEIEQLRRVGGSAAPAPQPSARGGSAPSGELVGQLLDRLNNLEEEVRRLRGRVDEAEFRSRQLAQSVEKLQGDVDFRLQQLEAGRPAGATPPPRPPTATAPGSSTPVPPVATPTAAPRPPERAIADGQAALARREFAAAEAAAREVLAVRGSPRTTDAQLLLGDALTGKRDFPAAALAYNDAYARNRTSPRAPEALLGLAGAFVEMGNRREACDTLADLRRGFPTIPRAQAERASSIRQRAGCR